MGELGATERVIEFAAPDITDEDRAAVDRVLRSGWLTTGPECAALEADLAEYLGVPHVITMASCTAALETAVAHLRLPAGAAVGVPTWTFASSALAAIRTGASVVLLDVDPATLNLSPRSLATALDAGLHAVIGVHFGGVPFDQEVHELCQAASVPLIEDAAHALGTSDHRGRALGRGTAGACLSFYATKNLTSAEGGALATDDDALAAFARSYRLHGMSADAWRRYDPEGTPHYDLEVPGIKANLPDLLAALARSQMGRFEALQAARRRIVERYRAALATIDGVAPLPAAPDPRSADHLMVVVLPEWADRDAVAATMRAAHIVTSIHFRPLHKFGWFAENAGVGPDGLTVADALAPRVLSLPLHPGLSDDDVDRVCATLQHALAATR